VKAVLLDALGTLVELEPPWPHLVAQLAAHGVDIDEGAARRALLAEMRHYRARCHTAADAASLAALRAECTEVLRAALPEGPSRRLGADELQAAMLASLHFRPYPEVPGVLDRLRVAGLRVVVVSNWDISLHQVLASTGLTALVDGVVTSAEAGVSKPAPAIFAAGLRLAGAQPAQALHAGDDIEADVVGARAAGIPAVLVARNGEHPPPGVPAIPTLDGLPHLAGAD
jgi:putative hydrolase of the HAD superfamily